MYEFSSFYSNLKNISIDVKNYLNDYYSISLDQKNGSFFTFWMHYYQDNFHETKQIRAYDIGSLIANIGGYIGMFLGYALLNLPQFFIAVGESINRKFREGPNKLEVLEDPIIKIEN